MPVKFVLFELLTLCLCFYDLFTSTECLVIKLVQKAGTATFNYSKSGLAISLGDRQRCMPDIGCFNSGPPFFHPVYRPVSLVPQERDEIATAFLLYTRDDPFMFRFLRAGEESTVIKSGFRLMDAETKIIVPGWMDSIKLSTWMQDIKDALLHYEDANVIIVDWSNANGIPFALAVANTRVVGAEIALLINFLQDHFGVSPITVHIIGHSLGTEIAGYAGERISGLGRITALDPAGPHFRRMPEIVRLDPSDALFVDAIHAQSSDDDLESPSRLEQTGHIDFYPNGGKMQPGCPDSIIDTIVKKGVLDGARNLVVCDHYRVIELFLATIPNHYGCKPIGIACSSWESFVSGKCGTCGLDGSRCAVMGMSTNLQLDVILNHPPRKYYLHTSNHPPFCVQQYHVSVKLGAPRSFLSVVGELHVTLKGKFGSISTYVNQRNGYLQPGLVYATMAISDEDIGVESITFHWVCASFKLTDSIRVNINDSKRCRIQIQLHSIRVTTFKMKPKVLMFCGSHLRIPSKYKVPMLPC